ncbi:Acetyltransferase (GNAT family) [Campylobacter concisus UNSWCS]|uniref:Acetyltransferase (GNAT family) n=1 Tax=Campylobacter concisus UNSWCS TaxID=1242968 RepID=U2GMA6_9BACT|nr:GNAT family N-acetyltransferase [Campylobacter concisus]ERJ29224.1 Acetyltransferase (GNAT family) [Campylobacter concisus UNSWCS]
MIKNAQKQDAKICIKLLNLAMEDIAYKLSGYDDPVRSDEILEKFFKSETNRLSYKNVYVYKCDDVIIAAMCAYFGGDAWQLDREISQHLKALGKDAQIEKECFDDEFYIDSIAVDEKFRGQGLAKELILHSFAKAKELGHKKVSLIVDVNKPKVRKFYESLGFKFNTKKIINLHEYDHMIKEII